MANKCKITPKQVDTIQYLANYGHSTAFIARAIGTTPKALDHMKRRYPHIAKAINVSTNELVGDVKANMFRIAIDGEDKHSSSLGLKLLDRYEKLDVDADVSVVSDDTIKDDILDELQQ